MCGRDLKNQPIFREGRFSEGLGFEKFHCIKCTI
jgi:hypothetical protein